ncbi:MAG TPA: YihY/virulence factor BrkB family protein [Fibrobacteria bacterium]|nr:YihY/virulence factor BrkB family protein [Fibrobacteria bacterium]
MSLKHKFGTVVTRLKAAGDVILHRALDLVSLVPGGRRFFKLLKISIKEWISDRASRLAAAVAYYTIFSMAPLLLIAIAIAGFFFGETEARAGIMTQMQDLIGESGAHMLGTMLDSSWSPASGLTATVVGVVVLLIGATGAFAHLQEALNIMWDAKPSTRSGLWAFIRRRLISFSLILTVGFLLMVSLVASAVFSAMGKFLSDVLPSYFPVFSLLNASVSFGFTILLFAAIYKILPDAKVRWRDVWLGAILAALLFSVGRILIGIYLGRSALGSTYGAAGSLVAILLWIYYSTQILFFGAEMTHASSQLAREESRSRRARRPRSSRSTPARDNPDP